MYVGVDTNQSTPPYNTLFEECLPEAFEGLIQMPEDAEDKEILYESVVVEPPGEDIKTPPQRIGAFVPPPTRHDAEKALQDLTLVLRPIRATGAG